MVELCPVLDGFPVLVLYADISGGDGTQVDEGDLVSVAGCFQLGGGFGLDGYEDSALTFAEQEGVGSDCGFPLDMEAFLQGDGGFQECAPESAFADVVEGLDAGQFPQGLDELMESVFNAEVKEGRGAQSDSVVENEVLGGAQ